MEAEESRDDEAMNLIERRQGPSVGGDHFRRRRGELFSISRTRRW